jgi:formylglycine-generating enzyme
MGTNQPEIPSDGESPAREVTLDPFCIDQTEVSNLQFWQFVQETNYVTEVSLTAKKLI